MQVTMLTVHQKLRGKRLTSILSRQLMNNMMKTGIKSGIATTADKIREPLFIGT